MNLFNRRFAVVMAAATLFFVGSACAQDEKSSEKSTTPDRAAQPAPPPDSTTQASIDLGGQHIAYTAIAGTITVGATDTADAQLGPDGRPLPGSQLALSAPKDPADGPPVAHMFYVAYLKNGANAEDRPITFFYNGGPGSSTMWLHMGSLGPKFVETAGDTHLAGGSLQTDRQSGLPARRERRSVHRHAGHGLWPLGRQGRGKGLLGRRPGCAGLRPIHRAVPGEIRPLELA